MITAIKNAVTIPVMAKCRIGHFVESQILEALGADYIDESEVLTPADEIHHINKHNFTVPFVCGCRDLGEALRRIAEGASMIRTKGEAGTGNVVEAVRHCRAVQGGIRYDTTRIPQCYLACGTLHLTLDWHCLLTRSDPKNVFFWVCIPADHHVSLCWGCRPTCQTSQTFEQSVIFAFESFDFSPQAR
jgi:hypothetical protein